MPAMTRINADNGHALGSGREGCLSRWLCWAGPPSTFLCYPGACGSCGHGTQKLDRDAMRCRLHGNTIVLNGLQSQGDLYPLGVTLRDLNGLQTSIRDWHIVLIPLRRESRFWQIDDQSIRLQ